MLFKKYILIILLSSLSIVALGQFRFGISAGTTISSFTGKDFKATDFPHIGFTVGFFYEYEFKRNFSIMFEPLFEQKGAEYSYYPLHDTEVRVNNHLDYFSLPVMVKIPFGRIVHYYLTSGLSLSVLANYQSEEHAYLHGYEIPSESFFPFSYKNLDANASLGFGIMWKEIFLDFRYVHGLRNIYKSDKEVPSIRNHLVSAKLAFSLFRKRYLPCYKKL